MFRSVKFNLVKGLIQAAVILILFTTCNAQIVKNNLVAKVDDDYTISFPELQSYAVDHLYHKAYKNKSVAYRKALDAMINNQLKITDFYQQGFNNDKELITSIRRIINEELVGQYYQKQFFSKYVNDSTIRAAYNETGREVIYQQIVLQKPDSSLNQDPGLLRNVAIDIKNKLEKGESFKKVINSFAKFTKGYKNQGETSSINWEQSLSNESNYIIFNMKAGEIKILESAQFIGIIKIIKYNELPKKPFNKVESDIKSNLEKRYTDISLEEFDRTKNLNLDEKNIEWNDNAVEQLLVWSNTPGFFEKNYQDTINNAVKNGNNFTILKYSDTVVDLKEYLRLLNEVLKIGKSGKIGRDDLKDFIVEALRTNLIVEKAKKLGMEKEILNSKTSNPILRNSIVELYDKKMYDLNLPEMNEANLRKFYEENKDSVFYQFPKVNLFVLISSDENTILEYKKKLGQGTPFEKLAEMYYVKTFIKNRKGNIETFLEDEEPYLGEAAFKLKLNEIEGPVKYTDKKNNVQYALIKCAGLQEEKQLEYKDVEKTIADTFKEYYRKKIFKEVNLKLRRKYPFEVYDSVLSEKLSLLEANGQH